MPMSIDLSACYNIHVAPLPSEYMYHNSSLVPRPPVLCVLRNASERSVREETAFRTASDKSWVEAWEQGYHNSNLVPKTTLILLDLEPNLELTSIIVNDCHVFKG